MSQNRYSSSVDEIIESLRRQQEAAPKADERRVDDILASLGVSTPRLNPREPAPAPAGPEAAAPAASPAAAEKPAPAVQPVAKPAA
ncbi:MAG: hypothetical protein IJ484_02270, partial [Oscillospiraceae bacterium]|nr:hypothetical protein [Oscillospiraceae bacterium]